MQFIGIHISLVDSEDTTNTVEAVEIFYPAETTLADVAAQIAKSAENLAKSKYLAKGKWVLLDLSVKHFSKEAK